MPVEFNCTGCGQLLRVPDEYAGKQARCPHCGQVSLAPAGQTFGETAAWAPPADESGESPSDDQAETSPYQSPLNVGDVGQPSSSAREMVQAPGMALIVVGSIDIALCLLSMVAMIFFGTVVFAGGIPGAQQQFQFDDEVGIIVNLFQLAISLGISGLMIYGGLQMRQMTSYGFAMAAAIAALVPCFGVCCLWDMPIGIWALVVLARGEVSSAFRAARGAI